MAQFNIDVDSVITRISQFICSICPGYVVSQSIRCTVRIREGLAPSEIGTVYTFDLCHVLPFRAQLLVNALPADDRPPELFPSLDSLTMGEPYMSQWAPGLHV